MISGEVWSFGGRSCASLMILAIAEFMKSLGPLYRQEDFSILEGIVACAFLRSFGHLGGSGECGVVS